MIEKVKFKGFDLSVNNVFQNYKFYESKEGKLILQINGLNTIITHELYGLSKEDFKKEFAYHINELRACHIIN